jgi:hypothetical protein
MTVHVQTCTIRTAPTLSLTQCQCHSILFARAPYSVMTTENKSQRIEHIEHIDCLNCCSVCQCTRCLYLLDLATRVLYLAT